MDEEDVKLLVDGAEKIWTFMKSGPSAFAPSPTKSGRLAAGSSRAIVTLAKHELILGGGGSGGGGGGSGGTIYNFTLSADAITASAAAAQKYIDDNQLPIPSFDQFCAGVGGMLGQSAAAAAKQLAEGRSANQ